MLLRSSDGGSVTVPRAAEGANDLERTETRLAVLEAIGMLALTADTSDP